MALSDEKKTKLIKGIIIKRIQSIGDLETLITMLKNLTWTKIKQFLDRDLQETADLLDFNSQGIYTARVTTIGLVIGSLLPMQTLKLPSMFYREMINICTCLIIVL